MGHQSGAGWKVKAWAAEVSKKGDLDPWCPFAPLPFLFFQIENEDLILGGVAWDHEARTAKTNATIPEIAEQKDCA